MLPAVMLTLLARTQALLLANPGVETLRIDPYAGHIANTARREAALPPPPAVRDLPPATTWEGFKVRWQGYGPREFLRRGLRKLGIARRRPALSGRHRHRGAAAHRRAHDRPVPRPALADRAPGRRRRRPRRGPEAPAAAGPEIFERFPAYLVPTYPGDHALFASAGFEAWLPKELPLRRATLAEIMEMG